jgi:hypothetical protein
MFLLEDGGRIPGIITRKAQYKTASFLTLTRRCSNIYLRGIIV